MPLEYIGDYERARKLLSDALLSFVGNDHEASGKAADQ
jgi:hypothetical protein